MSPCPGWSGDTRSNRSRLAKLTSRTIWFAHHPGLPRAVPIHQFGRWREYLQSLDDLFHLLHDTPPPIDYQGLNRGPQHLRPVAKQLIPGLRASAGTTFTLAD